MIVTIGTIETIENLQVHPLYANPLKTVKMTSTEIIIIAHAQDATLVIVMIAGTPNTSQSLIITRAKIIIPNLVTNQGPLIVSLKTHVLTMAIYSST